MQSKPGANLGSLRDHNAAVVLDLIRRRDGISRVDLANSSGLTAQAVSKIVTRLIDGGLVAESGQVAPTVGRPTTLLRLVPSARHAIGVHLDRDELRLVLVDLAGRVIAAEHRPGLVASIGELAEPIRALASTVDSATLAGVGVGCPGPVDHRTGVLHRANRLPGWENAELGPMLTAALELPVIVDKDTNAAVLAELWATDVPRQTAMIYVGTGIGAGLVLDGRVYRGARTNAGEFGHMIIALDGPACVCGRRGCLEALCGPAAVVARAAGEPVPESLVLTRFAQLDHAEVDWAGDILGVAVKDLVNLLDLDRVVLAGRAAPPYQDGIRRALRGTEVELTLSGWGPQLVAVGAATSPLAASLTASDALAARRG
ncbi:ROK family transcriptional regulator [Kutzneria buriramensis]|uniref:Putative NBD/HSP70 family sugar kinase n=1 Tax=Kutzneria buriramensis TaxID=1045776 RepID=A0A3E0H1V9_9PSEU|nr:ROK family transcriptional regulator [Kutzneria buriramensis]REH37014.1 putative NBD/HSP70 family sugar kinase [Kutzneria buriramensis]